MSARANPAALPGVAAAIDYAERVTAGAQPAGTLVRQSCQRFLHDLEAALRATGGWEFRPDLAERPMVFAGLLPNIKGPQAGQPLRLMPWQCFVFANLFGFVERGTVTRRFRQSLVWVPRGNGKGLALNEQIATPDGFVAMADVKVGDLVLDRDGLPCPVSYASPVHVGLPCYAVSFNTGERIVCDDQHLWLTQDTRERDNARYRANPNRRIEGYAGAHGRHVLGRWTGTIESVKPVTEVAASLEYGNSHKRHGRRQKNHRVRLAAALQTPEADLPIDPYVLGYWLGDGTTTTGQITVGRQDLAAFEAQMAASGEPARRLAYPSLAGKAPQFILGSAGRGGASPGVSLQARLRSLGLLGNKHIPAAYLRAGLAQRWRLLQGLMDSDGSATPTGQCEFAVKVLDLAEDVRELAASLGLRPTLARRGDAVLRGRVVGDRYRVQFQAYSDQPVFGLARKQERLKLRAAKGSYQRNRIIVAVDPVPSVPTRCIQVESASRTYLVGRSFIPTHNTTLAAPIALYLTFLDGEGGAEGYAAAVTRDQARLLFDVAKEMFRRSPEFQARFGVAVNANAIYQARTASKFVPVSSDAKALDGLNVQVSVLDEIGSHKTAEVYDVMLTAMGKRRHPLQLSISTATGNTSGIGKQLWDYGVRVLQGKQADERLFVLVYTIDEGDDPWDEACWVKANPSWGVAVQPDAIRAIMRQARNNPAQEAAAMTRHLNLWVGADEALFSMRAWRSCADTALSGASAGRFAELDGLEGGQCHLGLDLASKTDLAALAVCFPRRDEKGDMRYQVFARCFLNEAAVTEARNASYPGWAQSGDLVVTPGNETDFSRIEAEIQELCRRFRVLSVAYDPWGATQLAQRLLADGVPMVEYRANTQSFSEPTKELDAAIRAGRIAHDGNPVLDWCIGNVVGRYDARSNVYPKKSRPEQKIDAAVALIMALGRAMMRDPAPDLGSFLDNLVVA